MLNLDATMDAIAAAITTAPAITPRAYPYPADDIAPPCAVVGYPDPLTFDLTMQRGADSAVIPLYFIVGRTSERASRDALSAVINGSAGIKDRLDGDLGGAVDSLRVTEMRVLSINVAGVDYLAARYNLEVIS